ncbi:ABC transporter substrate-binding protein [Paroceanicella profunda]|uniref:ABC transporter substrate-binding protein n=1 Tax=Paroceanicella profunda TaxID=2579971 RepID=A0A5B8FXF8_9RHOB|nr:ABC transporter substrate-binding protein [Paroceanicella profunda]QDL90783.1 ABC transporter substrate-binding protein [Paroceanicella profunda]
MTDLTRRSVLLTAAAGALAPVLPRAALADSRADTVRYVVGTVWNGLDPVGFGNSREAMGLSANVYDRLVRFGRKREGAAWTFDFDTIEPELCESVSRSADGLTLTFRLRPDATWHDGTPVTAEDVKWSLDRAVSAETMGRAQLATGSLADPSQIRILDPCCVRVSLPRADRLALPNLATVHAPMMNSRAARAHATAQDPWATDWLRTNTAAGGAYRVERMSPDGTQVVLTRFEAWKSGPRPGLGRVIVQAVPDPSTRALLIERGDADLCLDLLPADIERFERAGAPRVLTAAKPSGFTALCFNTRMAPFDDARVRRAVALALPYAQMFEQAASGRGEALSGAGWTEPPSGDFPQPMPFDTDMDAAAALLAQAGLADGFDTELFYGVSKATWADPAAALAQEALSRLGIRLRIRKLPDAQMAEVITARSAPLLMESSVALFPSTEYFFRIFLSGDQRWNFPGWANPEVEALLPKARFEPDAEAYEAIARRLVALAAEDVPMAPLWRPVQDIALAQDLQGYTTSYFYKADFRQLERG